MGQACMPSSALRSQPLTPKGTRSAGNTQAECVMQKMSSGSSPTPALCGKYKEVLGKYTMMTGDADVMGEGTSSICRKGKVITTGQAVAIKVYKEIKRKRERVTTLTRREDQALTLKKFQRQIAVLTDLMLPFVKPADETLWNPEMANLVPEKVFMQLIDYSRGIDGQPAADPSDGVIYVVTEIASYSMKDFITERRQEKRPLSKESVREICKAVISITAGLHAKGYVHLDLKPENMMVFDGAMKIIDVDGCVKIGAIVSISDSSLSFSPCYCAPEWAAFLIEDADEPTIIAQPGLDVWSIGVTLCELTVLDAVLKPMYASFLKHGRSQREAGFCFMEWLSSLQKTSFAKRVEVENSELADLLLTYLLVPDPKKRRSCASALMSPYLHSNISYRKSKTSPLTCDPLFGDDFSRPREHQRRPRIEDVSDKYLFQGALWKLNSGGSPKDVNQWYLRDTWIAGNGSLCYFSKKEDRRLVLLEAELISNATVEVFGDSGKAYCFSLHTMDDADDMFFAAESAADFNAWMMALSKVKMGLMSTMQLGSNLVADFRSYRMAVKNRRLKVDHGSDLHESVFRARLWKVKADGSRLKPGDWFERDMWLSKNGSLVYWSAKEQRDLVYYTSSDLATAQLSMISDATTCRPWAFEVRLEPKNGVDFAPGEFAAESQEMRDRWFAEFGRLY